MILFSAYISLQDRSLVVSGYGDVRDTIFGRDLSYLLFAAYLSLIVLLVRILDAVLFDFIFTRRRNIVAPLLLREILSIGFYLAGLAWALSSVFKYHITALLTTTTVLAAVIGLALQDTLGNLFSGISLHMESTFEVGDVVKSGEMIGVVENVNWRATRMRSFENYIIVLPNAVIARERLLVFPRATLNARTLTVGLSYDTPPAEAISVLEKAVTNVSGLSREKPIVVRIGSFQDSAVHYEIKYWTRDYARHDDIDAAVLRAVWYALKRSDISIAYPIRSIHRLRPIEHPKALSRDDILSRLQAVDILLPLSNEEHETIAAGTDVHVYSQGETIIRMGDRGHSMFIVHEGLVSIRIGDGSKELAQLGGGSVFGEMAFLTGESRSADVVALSDATVLEIDKSALQPVLKNNPDLVNGITEKVIARRDHLATSLAESDAEEKKSVLGKIRAYFAL
ncbi:MAG TPA: mechanosensitive ion channel family protein [Thermoanaerobaculia bacterium]|nr:mechanosensitive ion channel family protein [Thermoanaerobaculia bacterium]